MKFVFSLQNGTTVDALPEVYDKFYAAEVIETASVLSRYYYPGDDISHLDKGIEIPKEELDLFAVVKEIAGSLQIPAQKKGITIGVSGESCPIRGVRSMIYEIVQNPSNNAMKYNVEDGSVDIGIKQEDGHVILTAADTGIGIPPKYQGRGFKRFYRVDKSHSRETAGTGPGLSIVKHFAHYHNARINLQSSSGADTTIIVTF